MFRRAYRLSLEVHRASLELPRIEQFALGGSDPAGVEIDLRQPGRRVWSSSAGRKPEFRRFLMMAIGSADEMQVWTLYCRDLGYIDERRGRALAGRVPGDRPDAHRPSSRQF